MAANQNRDKPADADENKVYVVGEDRLDEKTRLRRAFDNPGAADDYVSDPNNEGHLFVKQLTVETEYQPNEE